MQKATLEVLLARKEQAIQNKSRFKDVEVASIGLTFTIERLPLGRVLGMLRATDDMSEQLEMYKQLIYMSVPMFQSEKLQEAYELAEPCDIVTAVLEDNISAIAELGNAISELYGIGSGKVVEDVKN